MPPAYSPAIDYTLLHKTFVYSILLEAGSMMGVTWQRVRFFKTDAAEAPGARFENPIRVWS